MGDDDLDKKNGEKILAANFLQLNRYLDTVLKTTLRDKIRDLADGDTPAVFRDVWVETLNTSSGDNSSIDTGATDADYVSSNDTYRCSYSNSFSRKDGFGDGTLASYISTSTNDSQITNASVSESNGELRLDIDDNGQNDEFSGSSYAEATVDGVTSSGGQIEFDITNSDAYLDYGESYNSGAYIDARWRVYWGNMLIFDETRTNDSTETQSFDNVVNGTWKVRPDGTGGYEVLKNGSIVNTISDTPDNDEVRFRIDFDYDFANDMTGPDQLEVNLYTTWLDFDDNGFQSSQVVTNTVVSTPSVITQLYSYLEKTLNGGSIELDISTDGGTNFDITGASYDELVDLSNVSNSGSNLVLRWNLNPSGLKSPIFENYVVKAWDE